MKKSQIKKFIERRGIFMYYAFFFVFLSTASFLGLRWGKYKINPEEYSKIIERQIPEDQLSARVKNPKENRNYFETVEILYITEALNFPQIITREKGQIVKGGKSKPK